MLILYKCCQLSKLSLRAHVRWTPVVFLWHPTLSVQNSRRVWHLIRRDGFNGWERTRSVISRARNNALGRSLDYSDDTRDGTDFLWGCFTHSPLPQTLIQCVNRWRHRRAIYIWSDLNQLKLLFIVPKFHSFRWQNISDIFYSFGFHSAANITTGQQI